MKKSIKAVCIAVIIAVQTVFCITAHAADNVDSAAIVRELFELNMNERDVNDFYDGLKLGIADWTAICHARLYGAENSSEFVESALNSAEELMNSDGFVTPTELQRTAIVLAAFGEYPRELINAADRKSVV